MVPKLLMFSKKFVFCIFTACLVNSDYRKRWRDVISQHPGHSHGYKSVMAALLKPSIRYILFAQMTQNAQILKKVLLCNEERLFQECIYLD